ncbi:MAG: FHA domain-containing protein [Planctomycetota bacterium]
MAHEYSSVFYQDLSKLKEKNRKTYLDILHFNEPDVAELVQKSKAIARVFFTRLEPKQKVYDKDMKKTVASSMEYAELIIAEEFLHDLSLLGKAMCLAIGRYEHNHFRPNVATKSLEMDMYVSREHGLVFLNEKGEVCYHDIGTLKQGSTNGTKINDECSIKNEIMRWDMADYFGYGNLITILNGNKEGVESKFKLRYELL